jgi:formamidopyrimidine-DNA glycosylase
VPELPDVEGFRRVFAEYATGKTTKAVRWIDPSMLRGTSPGLLSSALKGARFSDPERHGKLLICFTEGPATLLLHFGMTGTFVWREGGRRHPHDRLALEFADGQLRYRNMRKFGGVCLARSAAELDRIRGRLGPDWQSVSRSEFQSLLEGRRASIKAVLLDQSAAAGLGNLTADEALWQARIDPARAASSLDAEEGRTLYRKIQKVLRDSIPYGLVPAKRSWLTGARSGRNSACPRCGERLRRRQVAGRTTYSCPREQA